VIERDGDVFDTEATFIGHGVNTVGVMGAGIAKTIRDKYPETYKYYRDRCLTGALTPGHTLATVEDSRIILNMATQDEPGANARYEWVLGCLLNVAQGIKRASRQATIAIPEIGCGIGGLKWDRVKELIEFTERVYPEVTFEVWHYNG
jgi:O-acetyl-ADP-ribose deacetylase (regulator of RNase III)